MTYKPAMIECDCGCGETCGVIQGHSTVGLPDNVHWVILSKPQSADASRHFAGIGHLRRWIDDIGAAPVGVPPDPPKPSGPSVEGNVIQGGSFQRGIVPAGGGDEAELHGEWVMGEWRS